MKSRENLKKTLAYVAAAVALIIVISYLIIHFSSQPSNSPYNPPEPPTNTLKAALVDQLSIHSPNATFTNTTTTILTQAGYTVDYYEWQKVTVNFFRNIPTHNYALIVLRTHSAVVEAEPNYVCIFTSELFNETKHYNEWTDGRLGKARFFTDETSYYFAITPRFVERSMKGTFRNTTIIMMGCDGLTYTNMAEAFTKKGAKVYISWDGPVSTTHTDKATANLLKHLITENQTAANAVAATMQEIGADPEYQAKLLSYPTSAGTHDTMNMEHCISHETKIITNQCTSRKCATNSIDCPILRIALPGITCNYRISRIVAIPTERSSTTACAFNPRAKTMSFRQEVQLKNTS